MGFAFSPNLKANVFEAVRLSSSLGKSLYFLHVGKKTQKKEEKFKSILQEEGIVESKNIAQKPEETLVNAAAAVSGIRQGNYPKDPEGFFIGRYPINQKDSNDFDHFKITCYEHQPGLLPSSRGGRGFIIDDIDDRKKVRKGVVSLPMQPSISEAMNVNWGSSELNPLQIMGANVAMPLMGLDFDGAMNALGDGVNQAVGDLNADGVIDQEDIDYADDLTLQKAFLGRNAVLS